MLVLHLLQFGLQAPLHIDPNHSRTFHAELISAVCGNGELYYK